MTTDVWSRFTRGRLQLMLRHPYLANAIARLPVIDASDLAWCETMSTDGYYIYVNPDFCAQLEEAEVTAVIAHEVLHCVLGHIDRRGNRDRKQWNVAIDYAVNLLLVDAGFQLPKVGLVDRRFKGLTAEDIYEELEGEIDSQSRSSGVITENTGQDSGTSGEQQVSPGGFDRHIEPGDLEGASTRAEEFPTPAERLRLRAELSRELVKKLPGREAGYYAEEIRRASSPKVTWQQLLARFFTGLRRDGYRSYPFNRKHIWRKIYLPSVGTPGPDHLVIAIDTSGSMDSDTLSQALAEIDTLRASANCSLTILQCDARIQEIRRYDPWEMSHKTFNQFKFLGRGGTSLVPPFEWISKNLLGKGLSLDALLYITDGYGDIPKTKPEYPTLWLVPAVGFQDPPFGELIRI